MLAYKFILKIVWGGDILYKITQIVQNVQIVHLAVLYFTKPTQTPELLSLVEDCLRDKYTIQIYTNCTKRTDCT